MKVADIIVMALEEIHNWCTFVMEANELVVILAIQRTDPRLDCFNFSITFNRFEDKDTVGFVMDNVTIDALYLFVREELLFCETVTKVVTNSAG